MSLSSLIDQLIEPFDPAKVRRRMAERLALKEIRQYDAAANGRRTQGWRRQSTSADREVKQGLVGARNAARDLVRNNKYAAAALRQMTANVVGDGITLRANHSDSDVAKRAQEAWDEWAEGKVDGRQDFYGVQKSVFRATVEGGEALVIWGPDKAGPNGRCRVAEGDFLDHTKRRDTVPGQIVQGVQFDADGDREAYWLLDQHPGDGRGFSRQSKPYDAANIDHVFEQLRPGQTRGISWFAPVAMTLRDLADYEDAVLMKRKVEACLALILTPPVDGAPSSPFDEAAPGSSGGGSQPTDTQRGPDRMRPGMVFRARPGETATSVNPSSAGDGVEFMRQQLMACSPNLAPYHLMTGDPTQSSYSSMRGQMLGFWANLDDWQWNMMVPDLCYPAFRRRMQRLALETGDRRFRAVKPDAAMPIRRLLDPIKDFAGELAEVRAGTKTLRKALSERGITLEAHLADIAVINALIDKLGLALEIDPRRVTQSGLLQAAAGYLTPRE